MPAPPASCFACALGLLFSPAVLLAALPSADLVIIHGKIYTEDARKPWAESVAIKDGRIEAVGSDAQIAKYRGKSTRVLDAEQKLVLPGFVDSHVHFVVGSNNLETISLDTAETVAEVQRRVKEFAASHPADKVIFGIGWVYPIFGKAALPDKKYLDTVVPDRPVVLACYDGHTFWANSKALELAGITKNTPDPANGTIVRDPSTGEATGALKETAGELVSKLQVRKTGEEEIAAVLQGIQQANSFGITRVHCAGDAGEDADAEQIHVFEEIRKRGQLTLRFYLSLFAQPPSITPAFIEHAETLRRNHHDDWLDVGAIKFFTDGVIEAHTAAMLAPYTDEPASSGHFNWKVKDFRVGISELDKRGFQIFTHAIGDKAIRITLDTYAEANAVNHHTDARDRIEHIEDPDAADIPRFGKLGVIASMQPLHAYPNADILDVWARNVGPDRAKNAWPWNELLATGAHLAFGSDWPVVTLDPWKAIQTLVTRQTLEGNPPGGWNPQSRISLKQAIDGYTLGGAFAGFREKTEGSIEPGKLADLIVVSRNLFEIRPEQIHDTTVLYTLVGGNIVYRSKAGK